ncbi:MAG: polyphosphate kinase 1 [Oscillospiraceae bacterium]|nr:polyphosphate kinase 1 [Oscillospiraceae bacterium]
MSNSVYDNRELSWLKFNKRVLEEADDISVPLMERLSFISIFQSNLDEFYMVRVGSLHDKLLTNDNDRDGKTHLKPSEQLEKIFARTKNLTAAKDASYNALRSELSRQGVKQLSYKELNQKEQEYVDAFYKYEIKPFISPQVVDKRHPFPFLKNKEIYLIAKISSNKNKGDSVVKLGIVSTQTGGAGAISRVIYLPTEDKSEVRFILSEDVIAHFCNKIFDGFKVQEKALMRVTRNADLDLENSPMAEEMDFRSIMTEMVKKRKRLCPVRLQLSKQLSDLTCGELSNRLELTKKQVFVEKSPLDMSYTFGVADKVKNSLLFNKIVSPQPSPELDENLPIIPQIEKKDVLLHYPYESIKPFIKLLNEAAVDPEVVSIKITLYRVAKDSKVIDALVKASENGKEVLTLVELRARFDEENNIGWSQRLEDSGCHVIYGPRNMKVHSKLLLITKKSGKTVKYITQVGTGNYNEKTSAIYTDLSLITANQEIAEDAVNVFNALSMGVLVDNPKHLMVAPNSLQNRIVDLMNEEIALAKAGKEAYIALKLNSLTDKVLIDKMIECSKAGVKIDCVIRGISCLVAGIPGETENIHIRSIVGRFLEHARIYIFGVGDRQKVYISSADFMTRNTLRRIEVASPILDEKIKERIIGIFNTQMSDNVKARIMQPDGSYKRMTPTDTAIVAQEMFYSQAYAAAQSKEKATVEAKPKKKKKRGFFARLFGRNKDK